MRFWILGVIVSVVLPQMGIAQDLERHGEVIRIRGETVEVRVKNLYDVPEEATGTVFTRNTVGGVEQIVPVAKIAVGTAGKNIVTGRITTRLASVPLESGNGVFFSSIRVGAEEPTGDIEPGMVALVSRPSGGEVVVQPMPSTATGRTLYRPKKSLGSTPVIDSLMPGRYRVTIRKTGYEPSRRSLFVGPDSVSVDTVRLARKGGKVRVEANPDSALISVDGREIGRGTATTEVNAGTHTVRVALSGYESQTRTLSVPPGAGRRSVDVSLSRKTGTLTVTSNRDSSLVRVDGSTVGRTPITITRPRGTYEVRLQAPNYQTYTEDVTIVPGGKATVQGTLEPAVTNLRVSPEQVTIESGEAMRVQVTPVEATGQEVNAEVEWSLKNQSVARVSSEGLVTGQVPGRTVLVASVGTVTSQVPVRVESEAVGAGAAFFSGLLFPGLGNYLAGQPGVGVPVTLGAGAAVGVALFSKRTTEFCTTDLSWNCPSAATIRTRQERHLLVPGLAVAGGILLVGAITAAVGAGGNDGVAETQTAVRLTDEIRVPFAVRMNRGNVGVTLLSVKFSADGSHGR